MCGNGSFTGWSRVATRVVSRKGGNTDGEAKIVSSSFTRNNWVAPANPTQSLADSGVSSVDAVAFIKVVGDEFNVTIPAEEVAKFSNLGDLIAYVDSNSG